MDHDVNQDKVRFTFQTFIVMHAKFHHDFAELLEEICTGYQKDRQTNILYYLDCDH